MNGREKNKNASGITLAGRMQESIRLHRSGRLEEAGEVYRRILRENPRQPDALHLLGVIEYQLGNYAKAEELISKAISVNPGAAAFHQNIANVFQAMGKYQEAVDSSRRALELKPGDVTSLNNLGNAYRGLGKTGLAAKSYRKALSIDPRSAITVNNLGKLLLDRGDPEEAKECFQRAVREKPDLFEAHLNLGTVYHREGDFQAAIESCRRAEEIKRDSDTLNYNMGNVLQELGRFDESGKRYRRAIELNPAHAGAHYNLSLTGKYRSADNPHRLQIKRLLEDKSLPGRDRLYLSFALGKIDNDCGLYREAFRYYREGNRLAGRSFDRSTHERFISRIIDTFTAEFFEQIDIAGNPSPRPVFIVGMPRSGTTLAEQIIASHPLAEGGGELMEAGKMTVQLSSVMPGADGYPECTGRMTEELAGEMADGYLKCLESVSPGARRVTDKMPMNFLHLGLLAVVLPGARVVHCRRDPMDTCLSCYFQLFTSGVDFAFDLEDLGFYFNQYRRLMEHWRSVLPLPMFELQYEKLVEDQEKVTRRLIDFCGLQWDQSCLGFDKRMKPVKTASGWQVRRPVYSSSVGRWKNYGEFLEPLKRSLRT